MKGITDINDVTVLRWYKLHNSFENGKPDWSLLYQDKPQNINKNHAEKLYQDLIFQMPQIKAKTLYNLLILNLETEKYINRKKVYEITNKEKPKVQDCENAFGNYFKSLENDFENLVFYNYFLTDNYKQNFKDVFKFELPETLKEDFANGFSFMHPAQLLEYANSLDCKISQKVLLSDLFFEKFILKVESNINLRTYYETLKNYYLKENKYEDWIVIRPELFNFASIESVKGEEKHFTSSKMYELIFGLEQFAKVQIDPNKDSIIKLNTFLNLANKQAEKQKPNAQ